jgi:dTDP-4-amino-4,6-dideoxygalactose transaminase
MIHASQSIEKCEHALARLFGRKYCILTGNGTSALQIAYSLVDPKRPKILLPAMVCLTPMLAVHYADRIPLFADVRERDATIDPQVVENLVRKDPQIGTVVAVHLFGHAADMAALREISSRHGVMLIEDLAQAMGGKCADGAPFGALGDCAIVSFGHTKILDVGGGGAFFTDDATWAAQARTLAGQLGDPARQMDEHAVIYRRLFYTIWECGQTEPVYYTLFDMFPRLFRSLHLYRIGARTASKILSALTELDSEILHRRRIASVYARELQDLHDVRTFTAAVSMVPWRFTFRINAGLRNDVVNTIRQAGYDVSTWYPSITEWTPSGRLQGRECFPVANRLEQEIVNLWVTKEYTEHKALSLTKVLKTALDAASETLRLRPVEGNPVNKGFTSSCSGPTEAVPNTRPTPTPYA